MAENEIKTEQELVLKAQNGDRAAFETLMADTLTRSWALAWRLTGNRADAEDLVQDTYIKAWTAIPKFRGQAGFATWLYRIELNCYADGKRKAERRRETPLDAEIPGGEKPVFQPADPSPAAPARLESAENSDTIRQALNRLDSDYKQVLVLREMEGESYEAIAAALNIPVGTVAAWLYRARLAFREAYLELSGEKI